MNWFTSDRANSMSDHSYGFAPLLGRTSWEQAEAAPGHGRPLHLGHDAARPAPALGLGDREVNFGRATRSRTGLAGRAGRVGRPPHGEGGMHDGAAGKPLGKSGSGVSRARYLGAGSGPDISIARADELQRATVAMCAACQVGESGTVTPGPMVTRLIEKCRESDCPLWAHRRPSPG
jgi:hypothetical protein